MPSFISPMTPPRLNNINHLHTSRLNCLPNILNKDAITATATYLCLDKSYGLCSMYVFAFSPSCILHTGAKMSHFAYLLRQKCKIHRVCYFAHWKESVIRAHCQFLHFSGDTKIAGFIRHKPLVESILISDSD